MNLHAMWELAHIGLLCGWYTLCAVVGVGSFFVVLIAPFFALYYVWHRRPVAVDGGETAGNDWFVAFAAGGAVLVVYWLAVGGHVPHVG